MLSMTVNDWLWRWDFTVSVERTCVSTSSEKHIFVPEADHAGADMSPHPACTPSWSFFWRNHKYLIRPQHVAWLATWLYHWTFSEGTFLVHIWYWRWRVRQRLNRVHVSLANPYEGPPVGPPFSLSMGPGWPVSLTILEQIVAFLAWEHDEVIECFRNLMYGECEPFNIRITLTLAAGSSLRDAWEQNVMEATALFLLLRVHSGAGRLSLLGGESGIGHTITYSHSFSPSLALSSPFFPRSSPTLPLTLSLSPILPPPSTPSKYTYCSTPVTYSSFCYASI